MPGSGSRPKGWRSNEVEYHAESVSNFMTQSRLADVVSEVIGEARLKAAGIDAVEVAALTHEVELETTRVLAEGSRQEGGWPASSLPTSSSSCSTW